MTGHRDLRPEDVPGLEKLVGEILDEIAREVPGTPLVLVSALAEGADRLAARVAIGRKIRVVAPLPMRQEIYERDAPDAADEIRGLTAHPLVDAFALPVAAPFEEEDLEKQEVRDLHYARVGAWIARNCHWLIALWDGHTKGPETELAGGTAQVVRFHREGVQAPLMPSGYPPDPVDRGPVWHVVTPRLGKPVVAAGLTPLTRRLLHPEGHASTEKASSVHASIRESLCSFNAAARDELDRASPRGPTTLLPSASRHGVRVPAHAAATATRQALADALAIAFQRRTAGVLRAVPWIALLAFLALQIYGDWRKASDVLFAYVAVLVLAWSVWFLGLRRPRAQERHQDFRALAEGLRVDFYWQVAGLPESAADHYLGQQRSELDWIRQGLRAYHVVTPAARRQLLEPAAPCEAGVVKALQEDWVDAQAAYHARKARASEAALARIERRAWWLFAASLVAAFGTVAALLATGPHGGPLDLLLHHSEAGLERFYHPALMMLLTLPAVAAALVEHHAEVAAHGEHARQSERMAQDFGLARRRLDYLIAAGRLEDARGVLLRVGQQALAENGDWVLLHRQRPVDVPKGG